jgi:hypothetical protein
MSERACGRAALTGEAAVAGRSVHVVKVTGDKADCVEPKSNAPMRRDEDEGRPFEATFWIDKQTFLPLRSEEQHTPKGSLRYDVSRVEYNVQLPETLFQFAPPAGARIFSRVEDLKMAVPTSSSPHKRSSVVFASGRTIRSAGDLQAELDPKQGSSGREQLDLSPRAGEAALVADARDDV